MSSLAYYQISNSVQSIESQRAVMGVGFDEEFEDVPILILKIGNCRKVYR